MLVFARIGLSTENMREKRTMCSPVRRERGRQRGCRRWGQTSRQTHFYIVFKLDHVNEAPTFQFKIKEYFSKFIFSKMLYITCLSLG